MGFPNYDLGPYFLGSADHLLVLANRCIEELTKAAGMAPRLNKDGSSECPFAEKLYAKVEDWRGELSRVLKKLFEYRAAATEEIKRLGRNRTIVAHDSNRIEGDEARGHYSKAEDELEMKHNDHVAMLRRIAQKVKAVKKVLQDASAKRWPGGAPQQASKTSFDRSPAIMPPATVIPRRVAGSKELEGLLEVDRQRRRVMQLTQPPNRQWDSRDARSE